MALEARAHREAFAGLTSHLEHQRQPSDAERLRASHVWDTRANPILARAQSGNAEGGALISASTLSKNQKAAKKELDAALAEQERNDARVDRARTRYEELTGDRFQDIDSDVFRNSSGEVVPNTRANRLTEPAERWEAEARASRTPRGPIGIPQTREAYMGQLAAAWGPTWASGPSWSLGDDSTTFRVVVVSCVKGVQMDGGGRIRMHTAPRASDRTHAYEFDHKYAFDEAGRLVWYLDESGATHYRDGRAVTLPTVGDDDTSDEIDAHIASYMRDTFGADAVATDFPHGKLHYRMEHIPGGHKEFTLNFKTSFLRERMLFGEPFGAVAPFLPERDTWAFMQDSKLPIHATPFLQLIRDSYDHKWSTDAYLPHDADFLHARATSFVEYNTASVRDVEIRRKAFALHDFHHDCKELTHIDSSASFVLIIKHVVRHDTGASAPVAPIEQALGEALVPQLLSRKHIRININPTASTLSEWFVLPERATPEARGLRPVCVEEDFIATWAKPITDAWSGGRMHVPTEFRVGIDGFPSFTVDTVLAFLGQSKEDTRLTVPQHKRLLSAFNLGADWYDESGRLVDKLVGRTHEIAPKRAIYEVKNGHLYRYDDDLEALFKRADKEVVSRIEKPSDRYPLSKNKSVRVFINQPDEIIKFDRSDYAKGTRFDVRLNSPLPSFLKTLRTTCSLDPDVAFSGAGLTPTRVSFNADGHAFSFSNPISAGCMQVCVDQFVPDEAYLTRYDDLSRAFFESIARSKNLSTYGDEFLAWAEVDNRGPLKGRIGAEEPLYTTEVDICRAYPASLHGMEMIPVCMETDRPRAYDARPIEPWNIYGVRRNCECYELPSVGLRVLLNNYDNRITGRTLLRHWEELRNFITIDSVFEPYRLIKNDSRVYIERILRDDKLSPEHKKHMLVHCIGRMGKKVNTRQETCLFSTEGEARYAMATRGGTVERYPYEFYRDASSGNSRADSWFVYKGKAASTSLKTGFCLAKFYLFCDARSELAKSCFDLEAEGHNPCGLNTDAVFIPGSYTTPPLDKTDPANLGKRSRTPKEAPVYPIQWGDHRAMWAPPPTLPRVDIKLKNEYSCHEVGELAKTTDLLLLGVCAGAGKTSMVLSTINKQHSLLKPSLLIVPNNHQRKERLREGVDHVDTYAHFMMQRLDDFGESVSVGGEYRYRRDRGKPIDYFKSVVLDEICSLPADARGPLDRALAQARAMGIRLFATGDADQLVIEHNVNPSVDITANINEWSRRLFPTAVVLGEPKRFPLALDKKLVIGFKSRLNAVKWDATPDERRASLFEFLKESKFKWCTMEEIPDDAKVISYTNETRKRVNQSMHFRKHGVPFVVGGTLVYRNKSRKQGDAMLYTNFTYVTSSVSATHISLAEEGEPDVTFTLKREVVEKWFTYDHASTVHSAQGSTYDGPTVIADIFHPCVDAKWVYVAMTRAKYTRRDIYLLKGRPPAPIDVGAIRKQIAGHLATDAELGRVVGDPITVDWVLARDAEQRGLCALCGEPYEMMRVGVEATTSTASIDRIGHRGHEVGGCQLACRGCNFGKRDRLV